MYLYLSKLGRLSSHVLILFVVDKPQWCKQFNSLRQYIDLRSTLVNGDQARQVSGDMIFEARQEFIDIHLEISKADDGFVYR